MKIKKIELKKQKNGKQNDVQYNIIFIIKKFKY